MRKEHKYYSEGEKLHLLHPHCQSGMSKASFYKQHGISGIALLNRRLTKYESVVKEVSLALYQTPTDMSDRDKEDYHDENVRLKKHVRELEKALAFFRLETEARNLMIARAEEYFNISIRKKPGAK